MSTHQSIPKPANAKKKSDILPIPAQSKSHPVIAQPKIESTRSNEEQLAQIRAKREASERLGSTLLTPESVPRTLPPLQPKLTIGQPNDQYEQEADRVARQVVDHVNAPPKIQAKEIHLPMSVGQRKPSPLDHLPAQRVQRYATGGQMDASPDLESSIQRARGGGQPLDDGIRARMEGAFGADFSGVRVHTDGTSDQLNQSIQAKAFTTGQDVFFRKGAYNPGSRGGQELLAHELTHVVQQKSEAVQRQPNSQIQPSNKSASTDPKIGTAKSGKSALISTITLGHSIQRKPGIKNGARVHVKVKSQTDNSEVVEKWGEVLNSDKNVYVIRFDTAINNQREHRVWQGYVTNNPYEEVTPIQDLKDMEKTPSTQKLDEETSSQDTEEKKSKTDYKERVKQLRDVFKGNYEDVPSGLKALFFADKDLESRHKNEDWSVGEMDYDKDESETSALIPQEDKKKAKRKEKVEKRKEKEKEKDAKKLEQETKKQEDKLHHNPKKQPLKQVGKKVLAAAVKTKKIIANPYNAVKEESNYQEQQRYHSGRSNARKYWLQNETRSIEELIRKWVNRFADVGLDESLLLEYFDREYPNLANYYRNVLAFGDQGEVSNNTNTQLNESFSFNNNNNNSNASASENLSPHRTFNLGQTGASSMMTTARIGETTANIGPDSQITEPSGLEADTGGFGVGLNIVTTTTKSFQNLENLEKTLKNLKELQIEFSQNRLNEEDQKKTIEQIVSLKKQVQELETELVTAGVNNATNITNIIIRAAELGNFTGILGVITGPLSAWGVKNDIETLNNLKHKIEELKDTNLRLESQQPKLLTDRAKQKAKDQKMKVGTGIVSTTAGLAGTGIGIVGLIVGTIFTAGIVSGVVALAGGATFAGWQIKNAVQGHQRGKKHKDLHDSFQDELAEDSPNLSELDKVSANLLHSDPRVAARSLYLALHNSKGEHRKVMVEMMKAIGIKDQTKLRQYSQNNEVAEKNEITEEEILNALKS